MDSKAEPHPRERDLQGLSCLGATTVVVCKEESVLSSHRLKELIFSGLSNIRLSRPIVLLPLFPLLPLLPLLGLGSVLPSFERVSQGIYRLCCKV